MKNNWYIWAAAAAISVIFTIVSFSLWLSGGKNKYLLAKKLKFGALLIALTGVMNGCRPPVVTCYEVAVEPELNCVDSVDNDGNIVIMQNDDKIEFDCEYMYYQNVSFRLEKIGYVAASDSCNLVTVDEKTRLSVDLPDNLTCGNYNLKLYYYNLTELKDESIPFKQFKIKIINNGE